MTEDRPRLALQANRMLNNRSRKLMLHRPMHADVKQQLCNVASYFNVANVTKTDNSISINQINKSEKRKRGKSESKDIGLSVVDGDHIKSRSSQTSTLMITENNNNTPIIEKKALEIVKRCIEIFVISIIIFLAR